jgi:hypothetical protein
LALVHHRRNSLVVERGKHTGQGLGCACRRRYARSVLSLGGALSEGKSRSVTRSEATCRWRSVARTTKDCVRRSVATRQDSRDGSGACSAVAPGAAVPPRAPNIPPLLSPRAPPPAPRAPSAPKAGWPPRTPRAPPPWLIVGMAGAGGDGNSVSRTVAIS